jgi:hypothetical protein
MLFKMLGIERSWDLHSNEIEKPRQVFVTKSRVLAHKVSEYFERLLDSLATAGRSPEELKKIAAIQKIKREEEDLVALDDESEHSDLPPRFNLLADKHFPLFITFDGVSLSISLSPSTTHACYT